MLQDVRLLGSTGVDIDPEVQCKERIRVLDSCLGAIEEELVQGAGAVSAELASRLRSDVPVVREGMLLAEAHDAVLRAQESGRSDMCATEARDLCDRIRRGMGEISLLLWRAHEGRAWVALGYPSWNSFIKSEFGMSRSRSYQLVDHGHVLNALSAAAGADAPLAITEHTARRVKPLLQDLSREIRERITSEPGEDPVVLVREVVTRQQLNLSTHRLDVARETRAQTTYAAQVRSIIERISEFPPPDLVLTTLTDEDLDDLEGILSAAEWLRKIADGWEARARGNGSVVLNSSGRGPRLGETNVAASGH